MDSTDNAATPQAAIRDLFDEMHIKSMAGNVLIALNRDTDDALDKYVTIHQDGKAISAVLEDMHKEQGPSAPNGRIPIAYTGIAFGGRDEMYQASFTLNHYHGKDRYDHPRFQHDFGIHDLHLSPLGRQALASEEIRKRMRDTDLHGTLTVRGCTKQNGVLTDTNVPDEKADCFAVFLAPQKGKEQHIVDFPTWNQANRYAHEAVANVRTYDVANRVRYSQRDNETAKEKTNMTAQTVEQPKEKKPHFSETVAKTLAQQLRDGHSPMQRRGIQEIPYNPTTGVPYKGINAMNIMMHTPRNGDNRWMEFDEANNAGYKVKKGEKGVAIQKWPKKEPGEEKQRMQVSWVYSADQLEFAPPKHVKPERPDPYDRVADILDNCGAAVKHDLKDGKRGFYDARHDEIHLPQPGQDSPAYYQDALHSYFKSTGHPSRLDRETFDSPKKYQQNAEELICSTATMTMCAELGIAVDSSRTAQLADAWADNMEKYYVQFSQGMAEANRAVTSTLNQERSRGSELTPQQNEMWRPVAEASPTIAVKTLLTQKEVLELADKEPEKLYAFSQDGKDVFTKPGTGYILSKTEIDAPGGDGTAYRMQVRTEGYDRDGNTYNVTMNANVRKNDSGLMEPLSPPTAEKIQASTREMALPLDFNGKVAVSRCHEDDSGTLVHDPSNEFPEMYAAYAERDNGEQAFLAAFEKEKQATYYASLVERQMKYQQERPQSQERQAGKQQEASGERQNSQADATRQADTEREPQQHEQAEAREAEQPRQERTEESPEEREYLEQTEQQEESRAQPEPELVKEQLRKDAKEKIAERLTEETMDADKAAKRVVAMAKRFDVPKEPTPYMQTKGVDLMPGVYQNKTSTCIPLYNADGELRSMAYADKDGKKNYAKGTDRSGCAYYDKKAVEKSNVVGFAVGAATAATVSQTLKGVPVIATMDAANLPVVVAAFKDKYPDKQQVIFANNNLAYEAEKGRNPGKYYAEQAAKKTGAQVVSPRFASDEKSKDFVDFNDLATKSKLGKDAVKEQCESALEKAKEMAAEKAREQKTEKERSNKELARG